MSEVTVISSCCQPIYPWANFVKPKIKLLKQHKNLMYLHPKLRMILFFFLIGGLVSPINGTSIGKIRILNKTSQMVRVHLSPSPTWSYFDQPNNRTLKRDSKHKVGSNSIL